MSKIELGKKYQTKCGLPVEILKTDVDNEDGYSVVGVVKNNTGYQTAETWLENGQFLSDKESLYDLVEVKETKQIWVEIFEDTRYGSVFFKKYDTKLEALFEIDRNKSDHAYKFIALKRVAYAEGDIDE